MILVKTSRVCVISLVDLVLKVILGGFLELYRSCFRCCFKFFWLYFLKILYLNFEIKIIKLNFEFFFIILWY